MGSSDGELTIYVGEAGEKYSDPTDWRDLIQTKRLTPATIIPVRREGALTHGRAGEVPELQPFFEEAGESGRDLQLPAAPQTKKARPAAATAAEAGSDGAFAITLQRGANANLDQQSLAVTVEWTHPSNACEVDVSVYMLNAKGRVRSDRDMIFYNQAQDEAGAVVLQASASTATRTTFALQLPLMPEDVNKAVFCLSIADAVEQGRSCGDLSPAAITVSAASGQPLLRYLPELEGAREAALIFGEVYRRQGGWRFRAVGQGFNGGLAPLARSFGVDVAA